MAIRKRVALSLIIGAGLLLLMSYWYHGGNSPLATDEITRYMTQIERQREIFRTAQDLAGFRDFLEKDDGEPFYTVNLYKFRTRASYLSGSGDQASLGGGLEAFEAFKKIMIPALAARGSHPVFGSDWMQSQDQKWDRLVVVRYRSRKDMADLFASPDFKEAARHKWASLDNNERFLIKGLHIPALYFPILIFCSLMSFSLYLSLGFFGRQATKK